MTPLSTRLNNILSSQGMIMYNDMYCGIMYTGHKNRRPSMFKLIGDKIVYVISDDMITIDEGTEDTGECIFPDCSLMNVKGICITCLRRVMSTEKFKEDVLPVFKKKYMVGNKKGFVVTDETKKRISDGQKRRWAERKQLSANSK